MSVLQILRLLFAFLTIFFTLFWNQSNNRFASQTSELGMFSNYPQAKSFLILGYMNLETVLQLLTLTLIVAAGPAVIFLVSLRRGNL